MIGKIIKGIAGFYYIHTTDSSVYECKAKGGFRNEKRKPLVGDNVEFAIIDKKKLKGNIIEIYPRKNELIRPSVSNVDQAMVIFATTQPEPNFNLLDRFLIMMEQQRVSTIVCFNKMDIASREILRELEQIYHKCGYEVLFISAREKIGIDSIRNLLRGKTTVFAGPSGVGKSSLLNELLSETAMEVGAVSDKIKRGKHTTRHSELFILETSTYIMDTPGFSSLYLKNIEKENLRDYFAEFKEYEEQCRFQGCVHMNEPNCGVKEALEQSKINQIRYENYKILYQELKDTRRY